MRYQRPQRLDLCGQVVWRLPYRTHHSIHLDDDGDLWVSAQVNRVDAGLYPNYKPEFVEPMILEVSQDGQIKREIPVMRVLRDVELTAADMAFVNGAR